MSEHITTNEVIVPGFIQKLLNNEKLLQHVQNCEKCQDTLYTYALYLETKQMGFPAVDSITKNKIRQILNDYQTESPERTYKFLWNRLQELFAYSPATLAVADGQNADQQLQHASLQNGFLYFIAKCGKSDPHYWQAKITIPIQPSEETVLRIHLSDGNGKKIQNATFHLCGLSLRVNNGIALLPLNDFRKNLNVPMVSMEYSEGSRQDGIPSLFENKNE